MKSTLKIFTAFVFFIGSLLLAYTARFYVTTAYLSSNKDLVPIQWVHINDFHAHYSPQSYLGSATKISPLAIAKHFADEQRRRWPNSTFFVSAGDAMEKGSLAEVLSEGKTTVNIYEQLKLDFLTLGNHDFAYSLKTVRDFADRGAKYTLTANLKLPTQSMITKNSPALPAPTDTLQDDLPQTLNPMLQSSPIQPKAITVPPSISDSANPKGPLPFVVINIEGIKVGVFGLTAGPFNSMNRSYDGPYYQGMEYNYDFFEVTRQTIEQLDKHNVDVIVLISHTGVKTDRKLAKRFPSIDLIIGGHSHTTMRFPEKVGSTVITQAGRYGTHVGRTVMWVDKNKKKVHYVHSDMQPLHPLLVGYDRPLNRFIKKQEDTWAPGAHTPVCEQKQNLSERDLAQRIANNITEQGLADAALFDGYFIWKKSRKGPKSPQDFLNLAKMEIQKPGTTSYTALYEVSLTGEELIKVQAAKKKDSTWALAFPKDIELQKIYRLWTHKKYALNGQTLFGWQNPPLPRYKSEGWAYLTLYCQKMPDVFDPLLNNNL